MFNKRYPGLAAAAKRALRSLLAAVTWRSVLSTTAIIFVSTLLGVALFEALIDRRLQIRASGGGPEAIAAERPDIVPANAVSQSAEVEFSLLDPASGTILPGGRVTQTFDQYGMRAGATQSTFPHARTIALVGDSFTAGAEVSFEDTLQARIAALFPNVNVMNFGVSASNSRFLPAQAQRFIERTGIRPDIYVVGLYKDMQIGDIPRREAVARFGGRATYRGVQVSGAEYDRLKQSWARRAAFEAEIFLREHSSTYNLLFPPKASQNFAVSLLHELAPERFPKWRADVLASLRELSQTSPGAHVVVWLVPSNLDFQYKLIAQRTRKRMPVLASVALSDRFWAELSRDLRELGFEVIDSTDAIEGPMTRLGGEYPFTASGHFRPSAYKAAAELIVPCLEKWLVDHAEGPVPDRSSFCS
jgi:hypothetical protein